MKIIAPKRLMVSVFPTVRNGGIFNASSLDLQFARTKTLDPRVTFTRASSGTYVDSQGVIRTATTNLLLRSEEFDNAYWSKTNSTVTANATTAPNGTLTAEKLITNSGASGGRVNVSITATAGTPVTLSCYAKQGETNIFSLFISDGITGRAAEFNLTTGTVSGTPTAGMTASIQPVGDGWYRCVATVAGASLSGTTRSLRIVQNVVANDGTSGLFIWGAQLEESSTVGEYIPTTSTINSAPRFDHNPTTGESLGLLVEEQRTNLLVQSNGFDTTWANSLTSETANAGTAPDGTSTAWELKDTVDATASQHLLSQTPANFVSGTSYTFSVWAKSGTLSHIALTFPTSAFGATLTSRYSLATGTAVSVAAGTTATVTAFPDGWYRVTTTATATASASGVLNIRLALAGTTLYQGDGNGTILVWGAQLEAGAFPTSYIPTTTATVTRSADVASITGANFSSWYRQDEGTVFAETRLQSTVARNAAGIDLNDNSTNNRSIFRAFTTGSFDQYIARSGGSTVATIASANLPSLLLRKSAIAYRVDDFALTAEGLAPNTDTSGAVPVGVNQAFIGSALSGTEFLGGHVRRLTYWPQRLSNSTLQQITQ